jgi:hypothetical protein
MVVDISLDARGRKRYIYIYIYIEREREGGRSDFERCSFDATGFMYIDDVGEEARSISNEILGGNILESRACINWH